MRDPEPFDAQVQAAYDRWADEMPTDVDALALVRATRPTTAKRPRWIPSSWRFLPVGSPLVVAILTALTLLALVGSLVLAGALLLRNPSPAPPVVTNGWIAFAANPMAHAGGGEFGDIYLTGQGASARRIIGSDLDSRAQGCPSFSPDGTLLAYAEGDHSVGPIDQRARWPIADRVVVVVGLDPDGQPTSELLRVDTPKANGPMPCPEWSADGSHLAFFTGHDVRTVDIHTAATTTLPVEAADSPVADYTTLGWAWLPDGQSVAVAEPGRLRIIPIDGGESTVLPIQAQDAYLLAATAGGQLVYFDFGSPAALRAVNLDGSGDEVLRNGVSEGRAGVAVSPDGSRLAYVVASGRSAAIRDVAGTTETVMPISGYGLMWSPDAERLLYLGDDGIASVALTPGSTPVIYDSLGLSLEWVSVDGLLSWQAVYR